jgi:hypothetical protein
MTTIDPRDALSVILLAGLLYAYFSREVRR